MGTSVQIGAHLVTNRSRGVNIASRLGLSHEDAEDAVQDATLRALATKSPFCGDSSFSTWFHRVVINTSLMNMRKSGADKRAGRARREFIPLDETLPDRAMSPFEVLVNKQQQEIMLREIAGLSDVCRDAVLLRYYMGLTPPECAEQLGISLGALKSRLMRGLCSLRVSLAQIGIQ